MIQNNVLKVGDMSEKTVNVSETFKVFNVRIAFLCSSLCLDPSWSAKLHKKSCHMENSCVHKKRHQNAIMSLKISSSLQIGQVSVISKL